MVNQTSKLDTHVCISRLRQTHTRICAKDLKIKNLYMKNKNESFDFGLRERGEIVRAKQKRNKKLIQIMWKIK